MRAVHVRIRKIGNSQDVVIPKPALAQLGLTGDLGAGMTIKDGSGPARTGWAEAAGNIAAAGDDVLVMGEFCNASNSELTW